MSNSPKSIPFNSAKSFAELYLHTWIEFNSPVYIGASYSQSIRLDKDSVEGGHLPCAVDYGRDEKGWWFRMDTGCTVFVPDHNVRYIYAAAVTAPSIDRPPEMDASEEEDGIAIGEVSGERGQTEEAHASNLNADGTPKKRRGRPPKIRLPE